MNNVGRKDWQSVNWYVKLVVSVRCMEEEKLVSVNCVVTIKTCQKQFHIPQRSWQIRYKNKLQGEKKKVNISYLIDYLLQVASNGSPDDTF